MIVKKEFMNSPPRRRIPARIHESLLISAPCRRDEIQVFPRTLKMSPAFPVIIYGLSNNVLLYGSIGGSHPPSVNHRGHHTLWFFYSVQAFYPMLTNGYKLKKHIPSLRRGFSLTSPAFWPRAPSHINDPVMDFKKEC